jgi:ADP-heptose:LPS heptosyltransferase
MGEKKKVILSNGQRRLGDALMLTSLVRDFKYTYPNITLGVESAIPQLWRNNPHIEYIEDPDEVYGVGPKIVTFGQRTNGLHIAESHHTCLEDKTDYRLKKKDIRPEIFLSEVEKNTIFVDGPYWVINTDHGVNFETKEWVSHRWQTLVDYMPHITFVQTGQSHNNQIVLNGPNVINFIDRFNDYHNGFRQLFSLIYNAEGVISLVSGLAHVAGAFNKPCVVIAGARESCTFEKYEGHRYLENVGALKCAEKHTCISDSKGGCFKKRYIAGDNDALRIAGKLKDEKELNEFCKSYKKLL